MALLLRLFQSDFFNSWIAISYLFKYPDSVGMQHYLCDELKKFPMSEIEFFLPQLCHLLISRTTESVALECFILESCEKSTHMAILTLWYLQAYRSDLSSNPNSPAFDVCKRVLNKCQAIVFNSNQNAVEDRITNSLPRKVEENIFPALAGIGTILAGIAAPMLVKSPGQIAIAQGRRPRAFINGGHVRRQTMGPTPGQTEFSAEEILEGGSSSSMGKSKINASTHDAGTRESSTKKTSIDDSLESGTPREEKGKEKMVRVKKISDAPKRDSQASARGKKQTPETRVENTKKTSSFSSSSSPPKGNELSESFDVKLHKRSTSRTSFSSSSSPNLRNGVNRDTFKSPSLTDLHKGDPFSLKRNVNKSRPQSDSFPLDSASKDEKGSNSAGVTNRNILDGVEHYGPERKGRLLKEYFSSEMEFLLALQDISTKLIMSPKETRLSTLRAELTFLNHCLPAEVCIPLWCPAATEKPNHHRIVRISPSDAVILNSADRVPYLLMVEVLEGDTSFDISKLQTRKSLHRSLDSDKNKLDSIDIRTLTDNTSSIPDSLEGISEHSTETIPSRVTGSKKKEQRGKSMDESIKVDRKEKKEEKVDDTISSSRPDLSSSPTLSNDGDSHPAKIDVTSSKFESIPEPIATTPSTPSFPESNSEYLKEFMNRRQSNSADEFAERMRTAAVMLAQLNAAQQGRSSVGPGPSSTTPKTKADTEAIRQKIIKEMTALEEERLKKMTTEGVTGGNGGEGGGGEKLEDENQVLNAVNKDDPSAAVFREDWETKKERIRKDSPYGHYPNWQLLSVIVKTGADLRQEQLACQLIKEMQRIWNDTDVNVKVWAKYYRVLVTSDNSGLIETITNSISIHSIKKNAYAKRLNEKGFMFTLFDYFVKTYGDVTSEAFLRAQDNFMRSLAAYSLICYILQVKDRHNGNLLLDSEGHLIHIDFGFMLSNSPGSVGFELAPFKLSQEYLDILGGMASEKFNEFKTLLKQAFIAIRKHADNIVLLVEMMQKDSKLPCFSHGGVTAAQLKDRFQLALTEPQFEEFVEKLIMSSCCNVFTRLYDTFQYYSNGIL